MKIESKYSRLIPSIFRGAEDEATFIERYLKIFEEIIDGNGCSYLFNWNEIPGNDNDRLIDFLKENYDLNWVTTAKIEKMDYDETIKVSFQNNYLSLRLYDEKTKVNLKIDDYRTDEFIVKTESDRLNIYGLIDKNKKSQINRLDIISGVFHPDFIFLFEVFCWDEVPGNDNLRLIKYLSNKFKIDQNNFIKIEKNNDGDLINVYYKDEIKIELKLNKEKTEIKLRKFGAGAINLTAKIKNGKLNVYFFKNEDFLQILEEEQKLKFNNYFSAGIDEFLVWFAQWMGLSLKANWDIEKKRKLISKIIPLYRKRGTKNGLEEYLRICTGYDIEIIDEMKPFQVGMTSTVGIDTILGGLISNYFIVNIKIPESDRKILNNSVMIEELINQEKPVHTTFRLNINYI